MSGHLGQLQFLFVFRFRNCFISITAGPCILKQKRPP